jgi:predicted homoserine dehydrogenase-like protein
VHSTPDSTAGDGLPIGLARRSKIEKKIEGETIETLRDLNSKIQSTIDVLTTEHHTFVKENDKVRVSARTAKQEAAKMKSDNQVLLEERKHLISMNARLTADLRTCKNLMRS